MGTLPEEFTGYKIRQIVGQKRTQSVVIAVCKGLKGALRRELSPCAGERAGGSGLHGRGTLDRDMGKIE